MVTSQTGSEGYGWGGFDVEVFVVASSFIRLATRDKPKVVISIVNARHGVHP